MLGTGLAGCFYALMVSGPLNNPMLRRFCFSHWTAAAAIAMFFVAISFLLIKLWQAISQVRTTNATLSALSSLVVEGCDVFPAERPRWLEASWLSLPTTWQSSWLGLRISRVLSLQLKRGSRESLESDLQSLSKADARRQRESYSLVRMIIYAIPILGLVGTTLMLSESDSSLLRRNASVLAPSLKPLEKAETTVAQASHTSATTNNGATNTLTAANTVATRSGFEPTVLSLALSLVILLVQFVVIGVEHDLLERMDQGVEDTLIEFLAADPQDAQANLFAPVKQMSDELIASVQQIVEQQANIWSRSISESQRQWSSWTQAAAESIASNLNDTISAALKNHAGSLEKIQEEGSRQIDTRWQQWQTTLSDQARAMSSQQKELIRQTDAIHQLVAAMTDLRKLEETIHESVGRIENLNRLEDASQCVGEAVAVLATSLERAGIIRGAPIRPRVVRKSELMDDEQRKAA